MMMDFKHIRYVITYYLKSKAVKLSFIALAWSIKGDGKSGYVLVFVWILFSFHLQGRHSPSLSRGGRGGCRARRLWEYVHTPCRDAKEKGVSKPLSPIPSPQQMPRVSLNLYDYTTLTVRLYYTCLVLLYRWRLTVSSYFNLIDSITISLSGVAVNFFIGVNESEIWHAVSSCWIAFQHGVTSSTCNSCKVSGVWRAFADTYLCLYLLSASDPFFSGLISAVKKINLKQPLCILSKICKSFAIDTYVCVYYI